MFKDVLCALFKEHKTNALALSRNIGVPKSIIYAWKNGEREPNMENLKKLADYFGVSLEYLCEKDEPSLPEREAKLIAMLRTTRGLSENAYDKVLSNFEERLGFYLSVNGVEAGDK